MILGLALNQTYKLFEKRVKYLYSDPYYKDKKITSEKNLVKNSDFIIVTVPHKKYKKIKIPKRKK